ncbi:MAG TPA: hypothetical protein VLU46_17120 [Thermoanaerobaculia bacterium]|nr:hypothetical protein [Thermoanaerobaculia bacterium]
MRKTMLSLALLLAVSASAQTLPHDAKVDQVAGDFRAISRITSLATNVNDNRQVLQAMIDNDLDLLREKRGDDTYRWASLQREEASRVKDQKAVERVSSEKELREVAISAQNAYRVEVSVPTKRNLFSGNNRVYVRNVIVDSTGFDGKTTHQEIPINQWVNPGDSTGVPLPEIAKTTKAVVELGVESGDKNAVADVAVLQAKLVDDPASPYSPAVRRLLQVRDIVNARGIDKNLLKSTADEALLAMPGELEKRNAEVTAQIERRKQSQGTIAPADASPDVLAALQEVARLMGGNLQDQSDARTKLQALVQQLAPATK